MDIEQLSKSQIVLLTLLVSFVTSIATGIVTVSLMDQAPPSVAQTVNRVIERTVQQVVPSQQSAAAVVTQEKTVVVSESDLISQAVSRFSPSTVRLYSSASDTPAFLGLGVVLDASGIIATDASALSDVVDVVAELSDSSEVRAFVTSRDEKNGIAYLTSSTSTMKGGVPAWKPASVAAQGPLLGASVVVIAGKTTSRIASGIVTSLSPVSKGSSVQVIDSDISASSVLPGSPLIDTGGALLGISTSVSKSVSSSAFVSSAAFTASSDSSGSKTPGATSEDTGSGNN